MSFPTSAASPRLAEASGRAAAGPIYGLASEISYSIINPMKTFPHLAFAVVLLGLTSTLSASMLPGAKPKEWPPNAAKHVVTIVRTAKDATGERMISAAEAATPPKADVLAAAKLDPAPADPKLWWSSETLGIKIPFAITAEAIAYYASLVDGYGKQTVTRFIEPSSELNYQAIVTKEATVELDGKKFSDVYLVTMKLNFSENFAASDTTGMMFTKERKVVLDKDGKVLHISGDGETQAAVIAI